MHAIFTVSLDFELHWGGFEKWELNTQKKQYFDNTRRVIPRLLKLFEAHDLHATWATVGMLMHEDFASMKANFPGETPSYGIPKLSAYHFIENVGIGLNENVDPYHFAASLVDDIVHTPGQELGTHTFAHYYCQEAGQSLSEFRSDLKSARRAAAPYAPRISSLVFPRNQFNEAYLKVCAEEGINIVRTNPMDWWWQIGSTQKESLWKRLLRGLDAYFVVGGKTSYSLSQIARSEGVYLMPASRLLRPYNPKELFLNQQKIARIKSEMTFAAKEGEVYHLWWHPHNFGDFPEESLAGIFDIADHFLLLRSQYGMQSMHMGEVAKLLEKH